MKLVSDELQEQLLVFLNRIKDPLYDWDDPDYDTIGDLIKEFTRKKKKQVRGVDKVAQV